MTLLLRLCWLFNTNLVMSLYFVNFVFLFFTINIEKTYYFTYISVKVYVLCLYLHCNVIWWIKCTQLTLWQLFCLLLWQTVTMFSKGFRLTLSICIHEINSLKLIWNMSDCCHFMFKINIAQWHYLNLMSNLFFTQLDLKIWISFSRRHPIYRCMEILRCI